MKLNKIIFSSDISIKNEILNFYSSELKKEDEFFSLHLLNRNLWKEEDVYFLFFRDFQKAFSYVLETYIVDKIVLLWFAKLRDNSDIKPGDVIIPNTFINSNNNDSIFVEYAVWENYDLNKFWLILNGICQTWKSSDCKWFCSDITDEDSFFILDKVRLEWLINKTVFLKWILWEESLVSKNLFQVMDLVV